ncbi:MAG TPA: hypothetical protein VJV79_10870 [Polyangiaceae bacterium]|nr:hypothetical protein [Polyangiaceae bacterium]
MSYPLGMAAAQPLARESSTAEFRPRLTYAITPPSQTTSADRRRAIAAAQSARVLSLPLDALLVYDVQDEAARNCDPRPFSFAPKVDPLGYAFNELQIGNLPRVVYRAVAEQGEPSLRRWLDDLQTRGGLAVLVGAPSSRAVSSLTLPQAFSLCRSHTPGLAFGGVVIPERHQTSGAEDARVWVKHQQGCSFFVSQTVWSVSATKRLLTDLRLRAELEGGRAPHLLLTFSPCGSPQTLEFLAWLGVALPDTLRQELLGAKDMLARSIELATEAFAEVSAFAQEQGLAVGCNVESVSTRSAEVEAAVELVHRIAQLGPQPSVASSNTFAKGGFF